MLPQRLEEVSLNAWPALQQMLFDGWVLRFAQGYTKRANSVNAVFPSSMDVNEKIDICEQTYARHGLPTVFRLTPLAHPTHLDQILQQRHYDRIDLTHVQHIDLLRQDTPPMVTTTLQEEALDTWMPIFCRLSGAELARHRTHKAILQTIPARRLLASLRVSGRVVACGLGVLEHTYFGLFDLVTAPEKRNKGYGAALVLNLLAWARAHGATDAYLQVVSTNSPARHLYAKLGFRDVYQYWYRVPQRS